MMNEEFTNEEFEYELDEAEEAIADTLENINAYAESVIECFDMIENIQAFSESIMLEASDEDAEEKTEKKPGIVATISGAIGQIFQALANLFTKGAVARKAQKQASIVDKLKDVPDAKIKIPDIWSYDQWISKAINDHVRRFDVKNKKTLGFFGGEAKHIEDTKKSLKMVINKLSMGESYKVTGGIARKAKLGIQTTGALAAGAYAATNKGEVAANVAKGALGLGNAVRKVGKLVTTGGGADIAAHAIKDAGLAITGMIEVAGGPVIGAAIAVCGVSLALAKFIGSMPKSIKHETTTTKEIYRRLTELDPKNFPSQFNSDIQKHQAALEQIDKMEGYADKVNTKKGVVYAQKLSELAGTYTAYRQALIQYYINILLQIYDDGGVDKSRVGKKGVYKVANESTEETVETVEDDVVVEENVDDTTTETEENAEVIEEQTVDDFLKEIDDDLQSFLEGGIVSFD